MGQATKRGRGRSLNEWRALFAEQAASGVSQHAFCRSREISVAAFYNAKARVKAEGGTPVARPHEEFLAVSLVPAPSEGPSERNERWDIELSLGADVVLRLRRG